MVKMDKTQIFQVSSNITYELIDDEVIIVNLEKGHYYSLHGSGKEIWNGILAGLTPEKIISFFISKYKTNPDRIQTAVYNSIAELINEKLIIPAPDEREKENALNNNNKPITNLGETNATFTEPVMEKYTDLEELLLLDPVHDIDEMGWPSNKQL